MAKGLLTRFVLKELADNGLDAGAKVTVGERHDGIYFVEDGGPGLDGTPEEIARLFSIRRPMVSTKLLRLPTRGALGNGLRVVAGAVLASAGTLTVLTRNQRIELRPERDGSTTVVSVKPVKFPVGTRIEIGFGPALPRDDDALDLGEGRGPDGAGPDLFRQDLAMVVRHGAISRAAGRNRRPAGARAGGRSLTAAAATRRARSLLRLASTARSARRHPRPGREAAARRARERQASQPEAARRRRLGPVRRRGIRHRAWYRRIRRGRTARRNSLRGRGVGRADKPEDALARQREPHAGDRQHPGRTRQTRH